MVKEQLSGPADNRGPKISLIIPVFNVESTLEQCLNSAVNQTLEDIEIIIVDDGSTDNSIKIAEEFLKNDNRVQIVPHSRNKGLFQARKTGVFAARGRYIQHLAADDWIDHDSCETIYNALQKNKCNLCHIGIKIFE